MEAKEKVLATMKEAGTPLNAGKIAELSGLDKKEVEKAMKQLKEEGAIVFDLRNGGKFHKLDFTCDYAWYDADTDNFYLQNDKGILLWGAGESAVYSYLSPYIGIPESAHTRFREIVLVIDGNATVSVYDEYKKICTAYLGKSGQHRIKLPYNILCRYVQIKVDGTGSLREIGAVYI